jgi:hypothetical protein
MPVRLAKGLVVISPRELTNMLCGLVLCSVVAWHSPRPSDAAWWGLLLFNQKIWRGPIFHFSRQTQLLRRRCDASASKPLPVEIIAKRKVAPAFEAGSNRRRGYWVNGESRPMSSNRDGDPRSPMQSSVWRSKIQWPKSGVRYPGPMSQMGAGCVKTLVGLES